MTDTYHYTECGLDNIYLVNGFERHETAYGPGVSIHDVEGLHQAIAQNICHGSKVLSGKEFRFVRKLLGLSQSLLGTFFGVSDQTVARWEKGQTEIAPSADRLMRVLFLERVEGNAKVEELLQALQDLDAEMGAQRLFQQDDQWRLAA